MPTARPLSEVIEVSVLRHHGFTQREVARQTGIPLGTVRKWARTRGTYPPAAGRRVGGCAACGREAHAFRALPQAEYTYLLGVYLGDGCLTHHAGRSFALRIYCDAKYPGILEELCRAIEVVRGRRPWRGIHGKPTCALLCSYWSSWQCLLPQHGEGRKHKRSIQLTAWQRELIEADPGPFLRGLIHSDGWRGTNRVFAKGRWYAYPRYQFSNRSDDIRGLFTWACDLLGVDWRPWGRWHISVARRDAVERLDAAIGPKT